MQPFTVEYITQGLISERSSDGLLNIFVFESLHPIVLEMLKKRLDMVFARWMSAQPCLLLYDLRKADPCLVNTVQSQVITLLEKHQELVCYLALVLPEDTEGNSAAFHKEPRCLITPFTSRDEATFWLLTIHEMADSE